jgi:predicted HNH restriction endonuclease
MNERYKEYLKSAEWECKKKQKFKLNGNKCEGCGCNDRKLDVHHKTYERIGMELLCDLQVLCFNCHKIVHFGTNSNWNSYIKNKTNDKPKARLLKDIELQELINSI